MVPMSHIVQVGITVDITQDQVHSERAAQALQLAAAATHATPSCAWWIVLLASVERVRLLERSGRVV